MNTNLRQPTESAEWMARNIITLRQRPTILVCEQSQLKIVTVPTLDVMSRDEVRVSYQFGAYLNYQQLGLHVSRSDTQAVCMVESGRKLICP